MTNIIKKIELTRENFIIITFKDALSITFYDDGQQCCEDRFITCDDNLDDFVGSAYLDYEIVEIAPLYDYEDSEDIQFLNIKTDRGVIQFVTHNNHNGYYSGFNIVVEDDRVGTKLYY